MTATDRARTQPRELPLPVTKDNCAGGTFIVTGANTGIGLEAAKNLLSTGAARVVMAVRNVASGEEARAAVESATGVAGVAQVWPLDLSSYESVKAFAARAASELERVDALVENAGVAAGERATAEGHVVTLTVNVLSTFLLAVLLMPKMREGASRFGITPHVTVVSSGTALDMQKSWEGIRDDPVAGMDDESTPVLLTYPLSKLMEILAVRRLARLAPLSRTGVVVNAVCPGLCVTDLDRSAPPSFRDQLAKERAECGRTADVGSRAILFGAVAGPDSHGAYLDSGEIANHLVPSWINDSEHPEEQAWNAIAAVLDKVEPGCVDKAVA